MANACQRIEERAKLADTKHRHPVTLGFALVASFSFGLALTMIAAGVVAAWVVRHAEKHVKNFGQIARRAPYVSAALLGCLAVFFVVQDWRLLP